MKNKKYDQKGITLIALVVTIVVMIILATASITVVFDKTGMLKQSRQISDMQSNQVDKEEKQNSNIISEYNNVIKNPPINPTTNWNKNKVDSIISEDKKVVPVPKGYTASTIDGENSVATGFVIKEGTNGAATSGINEFVWVPVTNISDIYDEENHAGQLWDFSGTTSTKITYPTVLNSNYREPDVITNSSEGTSSTGGTLYDAVLTNLQEAGSSATTAEEFKTQLQSEFNSMIESIKVYGGFYIGRYETGNLSQTKAVVQKYNTDIGTQTWYTQYKLNKTIGANSNVTTSMIWGCQWDATLRWMQTSSIDRIKNFVTDSSKYGNFKDNELIYKESKDGIERTKATSTSLAIPTGGAETTKINNIYDMAGNMWDWTIETYGTYHRVLQGSSFYAAGIEQTKVARRSNSGYPTDIRDSWGSRATLYITP